MTGYKVIIIPVNVDETKFKDIISFSSETTKKNFLVGTREGYYNINKYLRKVDYPHEYVNIYWEVDFIFEGSLDIHYTIDGGLFKIDLSEEMGIRYLRKGCFRLACMDDTYDKKTKQFIKNEIVLLNKMNLSDKDKKIMLMYRSILASLYRGLYKPLEIFSHDLIIDDLIVDSN